MQNGFCKVLMAVALAAATATAPAAADHLLLSEMGIGLSVQTSNESAEYVEIFNPTTQAVSLDNVWFTDSNWYKNLPKTPGGTSHGTSDCLLRFPAGYTLQPGQVAIITGGSTNFYNLFFAGSETAFSSQPGSPLLFQVGDASTGSAPQMITKNTNAASRAFSLTNVTETGGEFGILFYWDGAADLVKDLDIVTWGGATGTSTNAFQPKTPLDMGTSPSVYLQDNGTQEAMALTYGQVIIRQAITEVGETQAAGNGLTGHDESTEKTRLTWGGFVQAQATPGVTTLGTSAQNQAPLIYEYFQDPQFPSASAPVNVVVSAEDFDGSVSQVRVFYSTDSSTFASAVATVDSATTFTANLGTFPAGTVVSYYAEATDNSGKTSLSPPSAPANFQTFLVEQTAVLPGDVVINEFLGNNKSSDAYEFAELHNTRNYEIDLSFYRFADGNRNYFVVPSGTKIPADGYVVLTLDSAAFGTAYPNLPGGTQVLDWGTFGLNNDSTESLLLVHPNAFQFRGETTYLDRIDYLEAEDGSAWVWLNPNSTGRPYELLNPFLDNSSAENWEGAVVPNDPSVLPGTPGARNSVYTAALIRPYRDKTFPGNNEAFTISANVTPIAPGATITAVRLMVDAGSGLQTNAMTLSSGTTYTMTLAGYPTGTAVKYYFEVDTNDGFTSKYPANGDVNPLVVVITPTPPAVGDVVINELLYNHPGSDGYEYIELYNTTPNPIDLSYYKVMTNSLKPYTIPQGTVIPPNNYLIITQGDFAFRATYGILSVQVISHELTFAMANGGDNVRIYHPNQFSTPVDSVPLESVQYGVAPPWPSITVTDPDGQSPETTGASIELLNPTFADRGTNGDKWRWTTAVVSEADPRLMGTPGAQNSTYAGVADWTLY